MTLYSLSMGSLASALGEMPNRKAQLSERLPTAAAPIADMAATTLRPLATSVAYATFFVLIQKRM
jgi:hypothetical protein